MFKPRDSDGTVDEAGRLGANGGGAALLNHAMILKPEITLGNAARGAGQVLRRAHPFAERYSLWRDKISDQISHIDFAPDLARNIGSLHWFRGMGTMFGLTAVALLFWPQFTPVEAAAPMRIDDTARDEFRSQMIMPLALGADSGRHMGATNAVIPLLSAPERPQIQLVATLAQGDSFARMLQRAGVGSAQALQVTGMLAGAIDLSDVKPGTKVDITLGRRLAPGQPRPIDALAFRARFDLELGLERRDGQLRLDPRPIKVDTTPLRIRAPVGASLYRSARAAGAPANVVQKYLRTLGEYADLDRAIGAGDEFDMVVSYKRAATGEVETGQLLYAGVIRDGKPKTQLMRWGNDGRFFEASGVGEQRSGLVAPTAGRTTSRYGMRRHPILGYRRMHSGLDFKAAYGAPIYAVTDGRVLSAGRAGGCGNTVKLSHGGGLETRYCHMSRMAVRSGSSVRRGQVIGYAGSTGLSTGPHLHYEMYRNGKSVDPASVQFVTRAELSGQELRNFRAALGQLLEVAPGAALVKLENDRPATDEPAREIDRLAKPRPIG